MYKIIYPIVIACIFYNCSSSKVGESVKQISWNDHQFIIPSKLKVQYSDSIIILTTDKDTLWVGDQEMIHPISPYESYFNSFYAYHYNNFLDKVYIDKKVKKIFRDSITILSLNKLESSDKKGDCIACNFLVEYKFKDGIFYESVQLNDNFTSFDTKSNYKLTPHKGGYDLIYKFKSTWFRIIRSKSKTVIMRQNSQDAPSLLSEIMKMDR